MPAFKSITSRIISLHVIAIGAASVVMPLALYWLLSSTAADLQHRSLRENAETLIRYLVPRPDGGWALDLPAGIRELYSASYGRYAFDIVDANGQVLFSSTRGRSGIFPETRLRPTAVFFQWRRGTAQLYGGTIPEVVAGRPVWVQIAQDLAHRDVLIDDIVADFFYRVGWITVPILLLLLAIDIVIFHRALRPVLRASELAEAIGPARIDLRLPTAGLPREVLPLVKAINQALDRLERGFRLQQEFTADAAHELRTPLTVLRTRIDTLADPRLARALRADIDGMTRLVNQLLDSAEIESFVLDPTDTADLSNIGGEVVALVAPLALAEGKEVALIGEAGPVSVQGNPEALFQAVRNVVDNAIRHTPRGGAVTIEIDGSGSIRIHDNGPGVPESERDLIFRRFWRRDRRQPGSAGLGLSIVARIVDAHGGSVSVSSSPTGGAVFALNFPLRRPAG